MQETYIQDKVFNGNDFSKELLPCGEYENCRFINGQFPETDLSNFKFIDCRFEGCNLSLAKLGKTVFREVVFSSCKMMGLHFEHCHDIGLFFTFNSCTLDHSSFYSMKIEKTVFKDCLLREVDFIECDLAGSVFDKCDLAGARFGQTNLEQADLRTAFNYSIHPGDNRVKKAKFSFPAVCGLLDKYGIEVEI